MHGSLMRLAILVASIFTTRPKPESQRWCAGLTLEEVARLADVVLPPAGGDAVEPLRGETFAANGAASPEGRGDAPGPDGNLPTQAAAGEADITIPVGADTASSIRALGPDAE